MEQVTTIGLDIAKHVFQVHGADAAGHVLFRKRLARAKLLGFLASQPACVVAMEACAGAHATIRCRRRRRSRGDVIGSVADRADENLMRCRTFLDPKITEHRGRIVKTTGDGLLVEFGSVVDALRCATAWQRDMAERNGGAPDDRIEFRIGINVGDNAD